MDLLSLFGAALGIGLLIFVHELGHYLAARAAGVRVEVFSLGFGQRLCGFVRNGTDYRLSLFPLGGYVRVAGEDPTRREDLDEDDLYAKGFGARALFFSGGVIMNVLFALVAFPLVFGAGVEFTAPVIGSVEPGGAAWRAGLERGDRVLEVDGKPMYSFQNMEVEVALAGGRGAVPLAIERSGQRFAVEIAPVYSDERGIYALGAEPGSADDPLRIGSVTPGSPAAAAGLRTGDRIVAIGGERAVGSAAARLLAAIAPAGRLELTVGRDDGETELAFEVGRERAEKPRIGVRPSDQRVVAVRDSEIVRALDLQVGDLLLRVDGAPFAGGRLEPEAGADAVRLEVLRDGRPLSLTASLGPDGAAKLAAAVAFGRRLDLVAIEPLPDSPAAAAGIRPGDVVQAIDGRRIADWDDLVAAVEAAGESPLRIEVQRIAEPGRPAEAVDLVVAPTRQEFADLGFAPELELRRDLFRVEGIRPAIEAGFVASIDLVKQLYVTLKRLFTGDVSARNLGGIVTISRVSYRAVQDGLSFFFYFLALLSINLAFINVLPIPVLDGGHLMFLLIERIKGSPVSARVLNYSQILGLVFVIALMVFVTYNDILRLL
jgi:regulator of sigma E protease